MFSKLKKSINNFKEQLHSKRKMISQNILFGVDIGTSSVKIVMAELSGLHDFQIIDTVEIRYLNSMDKKKYDIDVIKNSLLTGFKRLENEYSLELKTKKCLVALPFNAYYSEVQRINLVIKENIVKYEHKLELINKARELCRKGAVLHTIPIRYFIDDQEIKDPVGKTCDVLSIDVFLISYDAYIHEQLKNMFKSISVNTGRFIAPPLAFINLFLNLNPKNRTEKSIVVDFGAESTYVYGINNGSLTFFYNFGLGSEMVTRDIAQVLNVPVTLAKRLKENYVDLTWDHYEEKKTMVEGRELDLSLLQQVAFSRFEEIIETVEKKIEADNILQNVETLILLGKGHPKGSALYLSNKWHLQEKSLETGYDSNISNTIGLLHYSVNNEIFLPHVSGNNKSLLSKAMVWIENLF
ncbi:MAG: cell division FtsA domain-containing protein [Candidatus Margulisbacteria bacterium]|nr:cell division FtsA domain-containing protein [Candidatus Margulisiibacteriota bacterium]